MLLVRGLGALEARAPLVDPTRIREATAVAAAMVAVSANRDPDGAGWLRVLKLLSSGTTLLRIVVDLETFISERLSATLTVEPERRVEELLDDQENADDEDDVMQADADELLLHVLDDRLRHLCQVILDDCDCGRISTPPDRS